MTQPAVLLVSENRSWLSEAEEAVVRAGGVVVAECPDVVSALAQAAVGLADVVLADPRAADLDRDAVVRLRRWGMVVAAVSQPPIDTSLAPCFESHEAALDWAASRAAHLGIVHVQPTHPIVAVFGTRGAPGASTLALALASRKATTARQALVDLDTRGGGIAGLLDLDEDRSVVVAADAIVRGDPWTFTKVVNGVAVLVAPSRSTWSREVAPVDLGAVIDVVGRDHAIVIDAGTVGTHADDVAGQILRRADCVVLVSRADRSTLAHLMRAIAVLGAESSDLIVVINEWRAQGQGARIARALRSRGVSSIVVTGACEVDVVTDAVFSGPEEQHQAGRGIRQHQDRHRHAGGRLGARWFARRRG